MIHWWYVVFHYVNTSQFILLLMDLEAFTLTAGVDIFSLYIYMWMQEFLSGYMLWVEFLGSHIGLSSTIINTAKLFSTVFVAVYAVISVWKLLLPCILADTWCRQFNFSHSGGWTVPSYCGFLFLFFWCGELLIFLVTFIAIQIFSFASYLFPFSAHFFIWVVFFLTGFMKVYARHEFFVGHYFRIIFFQFIFSLFVLPLCAEFLHFIALKIVHLTIKMWNLLKFFLWFYTFCGPLSFLKNSFIKV